VAQAVDPRSTGTPTVQPFRAAPGNGLPQPRFVVRYSPREGFRLVPAGQSQAAHADVNAVTLRIFDPQNNWLRVEASPGQSATHTPRDANGVFTSVFDPTNNAIHVTCVSGCGAVFGTDLSAVDSTHQRVVGLEGVPLTATPPSLSQCLVFAGGSWGPGACTAGGVMLTPAASQTIQPASDIVPLNIQGSASGTSNLQNWSTSGGIPMAWVDNAGTLHAPSFSSTGAGTGIMDLTTGMLTPGNLSQVRLGAFTNNVLVYSENAGPILPRVTGLSIPNATCSAALASSNSASETGNTVTIAASSALPSCLTAGATIVISGVTAVTQYNGTWTVTSVGSPSSTNFTFTSPTTGLGNGNGGTATVPGTTISSLAKLVPSSSGSTATSTAVYPSTQDTSGAVGIVVSGQGTSGSALIVQTGYASCAFDGATTSGDYVQISPTTAGDCHDAGSAYPASGQVVGRVLSTNASPGSYTVDLMVGAEVRAGGGVTSVGLSAPAGYTVSGSPVTTSGTLSLATPITSMGDLIVGNGTNSSTRLPIGLSGQCLTSNGITAAWGLCGPVTTWNSIQPPTGNSTLAMAGNTAAFSWAGPNAANWTWDANGNASSASTTPATSSAPQASPVFKLCGTYWNGTASAADCWSLQDAVGNGANGSSTLTFLQNGSTGTTTISVPAKILGPSFQSSLLLMSNAYQSSGVAANTPLVGGQDTNATGMTIGTGIVRGGDNTSAGTSTSAAGNILVRGGNDSSSSPSSAAGNAVIAAGVANGGAAQGTQGIIAQVASFTKNGAISARNDLVCAASTAMTVTDCSPGAANVIGVNLENGTAISAVYAGEVTINIDSTPAPIVGHTVCVSTATAGHIVDSGGTGACSNGLVVGVLLAISGTWKIPDPQSQTGTISLTASSSAPLVMLRPH